LDLALDRGVLDGVGDGLGTGDGDVEHTLLKEPGPGGDLGYQGPTAGSLRKVRSEGDRADCWF
jgi:hypothetical protein